MNHLKKKNVVVLCAGTGGSQLLSGLKTYPMNLSAVVNVTDNGGASKEIRESLSLPQPGDSRKCMSALFSKSASSDQRALQNFFSYRFGRGALKGLSMGNFMLAAFAEMDSSRRLSQGIARASTMLALDGTVIPVTDESRQICARCVDGTVICGEWKIITRSPRVKIATVFLNKRATAVSSALEAVHKAEVLFIAPGSLYTGIIPLFLMGGMKSALGASRAKKIWVANVLSQPGLTDEMTIARHILEIEKYAKVLLDCVVVNTGLVSHALLRHYKKFGADVLQEGDIPARMSVVWADCIESHVAQSARTEKARGEGFEKWKQWSHLLRHDSIKLGRALKIFLQ